MPLTKEEKRYIEQLKDFWSAISESERSLITIIDRLVAENEELRAEKKLAIVVATEFRKSSNEQEEEIETLQSRLDAIKKAWGETLTKYNSVAHHFSFVCDEEIELGDAIEALDKLIGGEK